MRLFLLLIFSALGIAARPAAAQGTRAKVPAAGNAQDRIALSSRPAEAEKPMRMACTLTGGQVFDPNGQPLVGATLLIKGTQQVYVTDSDGRFLLTSPVYQGQVLEVQSAGYAMQEVPLTDCTLPRLVLEKLPDARIKRSGKRAGQVTRLHNRSTNLK